MTVGVRADWPWHARLVGLLEGRVSARLQQTLPKASREEVEVMGGAALHGAEFIVVLLGAVIFGVIRWSATHQETASAGQRFLALVALIGIVLVGLYVVNAVTSS